MTEPITDVDTLKEAINLMDKPENLGLDNNVRKPKRVLHFSDGIIEEFSSEEDEVDEATNQIDVNPTELTWMPWFLYQTTSVGVKTLGVFDYIGESLASFFGITTPKYQFEINEYYRVVKAEEEAKKKQDLEMGGWGEVDCSEVIQNQYATDFSPVKLPLEKIVKNEIKNTTIENNSFEKF